LLDVTEEEVVEPAPVAAAVDWKLSHFVDSQQQQQQQQQQLQCFEAEESFVFLVAADF